MNETKTDEIRILVVDDDADVARGTARLLQNAGYAIATAANGVEALQTVRTFQPHLVLSDRDMPQMDGMEMCRRIKSDPALAGVFVVLISGTFSLSEEQSEGLESGADGYIGRPIANRELAARVSAFARILRLDRALRESKIRYRAVVEDQTEVISRFRADGTFTFVSEVFCRFFGKAAGELLGKKWQPVAFPEDLPHIDGKLREISPSNPVVVIENRVYSACGQVHWMQFVNRGFFDAQGRLTETQSVGRDITERRKSEEALREKNAELEAALARVKLLSGLLPICAGCKKIRDDKGYWSQVESYIAKHSEATFTHGLCPDCIKKYYPDYEEGAKP